MPVPRCLAATRGSSAALGSCPPNRSPWGSAELGGSRGHSTSTELLSKGRGRSALGSQPWCCRWELGIGPNTQALSVIKKKKFKSFHQPVVDNTHDRKINWFGINCYFYWPIICSEVRETSSHKQVSLGQLSALQPQSCHSTPPFRPENMHFCITASVACESQTQSRLRPCAGVPRRQSGAVGRAQDAARLELVLIKCDKCLRLHARRENPARAQACKRKCGYVH